MLLAGIYVYYASTARGSSLEGRDAILLATIAVTLVYCLVALRNRTGGALCLRWYSTVCCIGWFGWFCWEGVPRWGMYVSLGGFDRLAHLYLGRGDLRRCENLAVGHRGSAAGEVGAGPTRPGCLSRMWVPAVPGSPPHAARSAGPFSTRPRIQLRFRQQPGRTRAVRSSWTMSAGIYTLPFPPGQGLREQVRAMGSISLAQIPRMPLAQLPTPLTPLRSRRRVGAVPDDDLVQTVLDAGLQLKRDDLTGSRTQRQQGAQTRIPARRCAARRRRYAGHLRRGTVELRPGAWRSRPPDGLHSIRPWCSPAVTPEECDGNLLHRSSGRRSNRVPGPMCRPMTRDAALGGDGRCAVARRSCAVRRALRRVERRRAHSGYVRAAFEMAEQLGDRQGGQSRSTWSCPWRAAEPTPDCTSASNLAGIPARPIGAYVQDPRPLAWPRNWWTSSIAPPGGSAWSWTRRRTTFG
jgi:hypothetical protein